MHVLFDSDAFVSETLAMEKELRSVEVLNFVKILDWVMKKKDLSVREKIFVGSLRDERNALWVGN